MGRWIVRGGWSVTFRLIQVLLTEQIRHPLLWATAARGRYNFLAMKSSMARKDDDEKERQANDLAAEE